MLRVPLPGKVPLLFPSVADCVAVGLIFEVYIHTATNTVTQKKKGMIFPLHSRVLSLGVGLDHAHPGGKLLLCLLLAVLRPHGAGPGHLAGIHDHGHDERMVKTAGLLLILSLTAFFLRRISR